MSVLNRKQINIQCIWMIFKNNQIWRWIDDEYEYCYGSFLMHCCTNTDYKYSVSGRWYVHIRACTCKHGWTYCFFFWFQTNSQRIHKPTPHCRYLKNTKKLTMSLTIDATGCYYTVVRYKDELLKNSEFHAIILSGECYKDIPLVSRICWYDLDR